MYENIRTKLIEIKRTQEVEVLYACEAGSRMWGVNSKDSDYDVRFIYVHPYYSYLSIDPIGVGKQRDNMEFKEPPLEISGWELTKALRLFRKSNPSLIEWLHSPIIYQHCYTTFKMMKELEKHIFNPKACIYHYLHMAENNYKKMIKQHDVQAKQYIQLLRPILIAKWILEKKEFPPVDIFILLEELILNNTLKNDFQLLIKAKKEQRNIDRNNIYNMMGYMKQQINEIKRKTNSIEANRKNYTKELNYIFQQTLLDVWGPNNPLYHD